MSRVTESELRRPILEALAGSPTGFMTTTDIIGSMEAIFCPTGEDAEILNGRNDTKFSQKVRNAVGSHRSTGSGLVTLGFVTYNPDRHGVTITPAGRSALDTGAI